MPKSLFTRAVTTAAVAVVSLAFLAPSCPVEGAAHSRPNVILIMSDDQGYGDIGALGNTMIRTPALDRLHGQSVRLTDFHVDPTCSPTRSALLTGRYSSRTGVWHTIAGRSIMRSDEVTLAEALRAAGYRTGVFGKWHLGDNVPSRPQDQGFDETLVLGGGGVSQTPDYWGNDYFDDTYLRNGEPVRFRGYCTDVWFDNALRFIEDNRDRPFFAYIPTNAAHGPYNVAESYSRPYEEAGVPQPMARFYGMITNLDENVGRLVSRLDELGLTENTILIFLTDNGTAAGVAQKTGEGGWRGFNAGMRGQKGSPYDGGHRVPCFVRYPAAGIQGGRDVDRLSAHIDLLPTILDLCQVETPEGPPIDGQNLAPLLKGEADTRPERTLFVHSQRIENPEKWRQCSVMTEKWRLINGRELYAIEDDPGESEDVSADHPEVVKTLRQAYEDWWTSLSERFDEYVPIVLGSDREERSTITCHDWHPTEGEVPWDQSAVRRTPDANGFWAIEVAEAGPYRFTLRQQPASAACPIQATKARLQVGAAEGEAPITERVTSVSIELTLDSGPARMQTWLTDDAGHSRGAFFVEVERLPISSTGAQPD